MYIGGNMQDTFKQFVKKNEANSVKENYAMKLIDMCNYIYSRNKSIQPEELLDLATKEVLALEIQDVERKLDTTRTHVMDIVKEKFPQVDLINRDINLEVKK